MKHAVTRELFAYWNGLRGGRSAPERGDIDPASIRRILSDTFILDVDYAAPDPVFPIRLSGTRMNALFLDELKQQSFLSMWTADDRTALLRLLFTVVDDCVPVVAGLQAGPVEHRRIDLEMVLLPLRHHGRTHARILGSIAPIEVPSWLGLLPISRLSLSSFRLLDPAAIQERARADLATIAIPAYLPKRYGTFVVHQGGR